MKLANYVITSRAWLNYDQPKKLNRAHCLLNAKTGDSEAISEAWFMIEELRAAGLGMEERSARQPAGSDLEAVWQWHWVKKQLMMWSSHSHRWPVLQPTIAGGTTILLSQLFLSSLSVLQQTDWRNQSNWNVSLFLKRFRDSSLLVFIFEATS